MDLGLKDKVAIVTGGSDGIGKATAFGFAREGARVVICARGTERLEKVATEISERTGVVVKPIRADVTSLDDICHVIETTADIFGKIDILVNNAGTSSALSFEKATDDDWQEDLDLKLWAAIRFSRQVIPHMKRSGGGRIINITTPSGKTPGPASVPTSVSRAAGIGLTKALSKEFAADNILVNTVCIGSIKSGQWERRYGDLRKSDDSLTLEKYYKNVGKETGIPLNRIGEATEAGDVIVFLASDRAGYVTGTSLNVDGGASAVI